MEKLKTFNSFINEAENVLNTLKTFRELNEGDFIYIVYNDIDSKEEVYRLFAVAFTKNNQSKNLISLFKEIESNNAINSYEFEPKYDKQRYYTTCLEYALNKYIEFYRTNPNCITLNYKYLDEDNLSLDTYTIDGFKKKFQIS